MAGLLAGRKAVVTGAGAGIGRAIALAMAREGARVTVTDRDGEAAEQVAAEIGPQALAMALDVVRPAEVEEVMSRARSRMRGLDILCANAGVVTMNPVRDLSEAEWDHVMAVNAKGVFLTNQAAVRLWEPVGTRGAIVNIASLAAKQGAALLAHYCASKFAVMGFTQALAREVAPQGIRVNCVCPGFIRTSMQDRLLVWKAGLRRVSVDQVREEYLSLTPLGRIGEPEEVADTVVFLCSDLARFITGEALNVTGGVRMD